MAKVRRRAGGPDAGGLVAYYRVSTARQGASGLGLEGQKAAVAAHAASAGRAIKAEYTEVESGKSNDRPQLADALAFARRGGHSLVIAKLDRLARNVAFTANLMEAGVDFVCCDIPYANKLTIHILAAVAEDESKRISERTVAALAAYKAGGRVSKRVRDKYEENVPPEVVAATAGKLGAALFGSRLTVADRKKGGEMGRQALREAAIADYADLLPSIVAGRRRGLTLRAIAAKLNEQGHSTRGGAAWRAGTVKRVLDRVTGAGKPGSDHGG